MKARFARSKAVSATRMASGNRLLALSVSSLSLRISQSFCSPVMHLPTLANLTDEMAGKFFGGERQCLPLIGHEVVSSKVTRRALHFARRANRVAGPVYEPVFHPHDQIEFSGREDVLAQRARRRSINT